MPVDFDVRGEKANFSVDALTSPPDIFGSRVLKAITKSLLYYELMQYEKKEPSNGVFGGEGFYFLKCNWASCSLP